MRADVKPAHTPLGAKSNVVKWGTTRCEAQGCKTCPTICAADSTKCHTTGKVHPVQVSAMCKTTDVIYVISCLKCGKQYVGETSQALHLRMNGHRSEDRRKTGGSPLLFPRPQVRPPVGHGSGPNSPGRHRSTEKQGGQMDSLPENSTARGYEHQNRPAVTLSCHFF